MNFPTPGELNRLVSLYSLKSVPSGDYELSEQKDLLLETWAKMEITGGSVYWDSVNVDETVTHRFFIRYSEELGTRPQDLTRLKEIVCEGVAYRVRRVTDVSGAHRFTLLECEELRSEEE